MEIINHKLQITNYKQITIPKLQITNEKGALRACFNAYGEGLMIDVDRTQPVEGERLR
jgi:hypothetical protein